MTILSETLRLEMEPLGVRVITVMLGGVATQVFAGVEDLKLPEKSYYHSIWEYIDRSSKGLNFTNKQEADVTAKNLVHDIISGRRGYVWRGAMSSLSWWLFALLPESTINSMMNGDKGLKEISNGRK